MARRTDEQPVSYLDNFLTSITETTNLPHELKKNLALMRDLDTQAQDLYERMQKQSKNHIARAKRSVQADSEIDEELLTKVPHHSPCCKYDAAVECTHETRRTGTQTSPRADRGR